MGTACAGKLQGDYTFPHGTDGKTEREADAARMRIRRTYGFFPLLADILVSEGMIEYVAPGNIDDRVLRRSADILAGGGLVAFPTDTSWCIGCSLKSKEGIRRLRKLSGERDERHFTLLCSEISQFSEFCSLDNTRFRLVRRLSPGPYVFILGTLSGTEKTLGLRRRELGVRIPDHPVPQAVIRALNTPLYSVTAKRGMTGMDASAPDLPAGEGGGKAGAEDGLPPIPEEELFEGGWELEAIPGVDLIIDGGEEHSRNFSTILDISGEGAALVRMGAGPWPA